MKVIENKKSQKTRKFHKMLIERSERAKNSEKLVPLDNL